MTRVLLLYPNGRVDCEASEHDALHPPEGATVWVDMDRPTAEDLKPYVERYRLHALAVEDALHDQFRAKHERYASHGFLVFQALNHDTPAELDTVGVCVFHLPGVVLSVRRAQVRAVETARARVAAWPEHVGAGWERVVHNLLDAAIDELLPLLHQYEAELDELEVRASDERARGVVDDLVRVRRNLLVMRRLCLPSQEVVRRLMDSPDVTEENRLYLRDVQDHLMVVGDHALLLLDVANGALSMHSNLVNERLNQVMKYLAVISTVALPFTVISGLFGMNFDAIPAAHEALGFWHALALMSLLGLAFVGWFRYRRWL